MFPTGYLDAYTHQTAFANSRKQVELFGYDVQGSEGETFESSGMEEYVDEAFLPTCKKQSAGKLSYEEIDEKHVETIKNSSVDLIQLAQMLFLLKELSDNGIYPDLSDLESSEYADNSGYPAEYPAEYPTEYPTEYPDSDGTPPAPPVMTHETNVTKSAKVKPTANKNTATMASKKEKDLPQLPPQGVAHFVPQQHHYPPLPPYYQQQQHVPQPTPVSQQPRSKAPSTQATSGRVHQFAEMEVPTQHIIDPAFYGAVEMYPQKDGISVENSAANLHKLITAQPRTNRGIQLFPPEPHIQMPTDLDPQHAVVGPQISPVVLEKKIVKADIVSPAVNTIPIINVNSPPAPQQPKKKKQQQQQVLQVVPAPDEVDVQLPVKVQPTAPAPSQPQGVLPIAEATNSNSKAKQAPRPSAFLNRDRPLIIVESEKAMGFYTNYWASCTVLGMDLKGYQDRACLIQISTEKQDFVIDAIKLQAYVPLLRAILTNPKIVKIFHDAEHDVKWLKRDFGIEICGLFDTYIASCILQHGMGQSLSTLIEKVSGIPAEPAKKKKINWSLRPLVQSHIQLARRDTSFLFDIYIDAVFQLMAIGEFENVLKKSERLCQRSQFPQ